MQRHYPFVSVITPISRNRELGDHIGDLGRVETALDELLAIFGGDAECYLLVDRKGIEPSTSALRTQRSPN